MPRQHANRLTIGRAMVLIAIVGIVLGLFAADREHPGTIAMLLLASLVVVIPWHLAIEGNRRDAPEVDSDRARNPDSRGPGGAV
jgi:hypothetical protein